MNLLEVFQDPEQHQAFPKGSVIIEEGREGSLMYVVIQGELEITLKDKLLAVAGPGEIVGEMALINSDIRSASVTARTDCVLASIDQVSFNSLLQHVPDFSMHVMKVLASRLRASFDIIEG